MVLKLKPGSGVAVSSSLSLRPSLSSPLTSRLCFQPDRSWRNCRLVVVAVVKRNPKRLKYSSPRLPKEEGLLYIKVDPTGENMWELDPAVELLKKGAVGVIPTDTVYAMVCDMKNSDAVECLRRIKGVEPSKPLSILCHSLHDIDTYTTGLPRGNSEGLSNMFRAVKHCVPGPYTFILTASKALPKQCIRHGTTVSKYKSRKNVGVRIPDDAVCQAILEKMDAPLFSTSVRSLQENQWIIDPLIIADAYRSEGLHFVIDAGVRVADPSTVVDMTGSLPTIIRQGKGPKQHWMVSEDDSTRDKGHSSAA